jgi:hypothetical protein
LHYCSTKNIEHAVTTKPTYQTRRVRYEIDRCEPQNRAIEKGKINFHALTKGHYPGTPVPENILSGLNSIGFWNAGGAQDWGLDAHRPEKIRPARRAVHHHAPVAASQARRAEHRAGAIALVDP